MALKKSGRILVQRQGDQTDFVEVGRALPGAARIPSEARQCGNI